MRLEKYVLNRGRRNGRNILLSRRQVKHLLKKMNGDMATLYRKILELEREYNVKIYW